MSSHHQRFNNTSFGRLKLLASGFILGGLGIVRLLNGIQVVPHFSRQPLFSWGLVAAGLVCLVLAAIPTSWIARAAKLPARSTRR